MKRKTEELQLIRNSTAEHKMKGLASARAGIAEIVDIDLNCSPKRETI